MGESRAWECHEMQPEMMPFSRKASVEVTKTPHYQGLCFVSLIASHQHCLYFMHEQLSDLEMGLVKSFQEKGKIALKTLPRCSCIQFRKITLGQMRVGQFNNGRGWAGDWPGSGRVDVTMESWQRLRHSTPSQLPQAINLVA